MVSTVLSLQLEPPAGIVTIFFPILRQRISTLGLFNLADRFGPLGKDDFVLGNVNNF